MLAKRAGTLRETILIAAEHRRGHGTGHLRRCLEIVLEMSKPVDWLLPVRRGDEWYSRTEVIRLLGADRIPESVQWVEKPMGPYDRVIVDQRETSVTDLHSFNSRGLILGIDAGGDARKYASYLIDVLPTPPGTEPPNIADPGFLPLPPETDGSVREEWPRHCRRILVVFGGENNDERAIETARGILSQGNPLNPLQVDLILHEGSSFAGPGPGPGDELHGRLRPKQLRLLTPDPDLKRKLARYDLVITHYGILAWEAVWARVPVLLLNPTPYHHNLAEAAGMPAIASARDLAGIDSGFDAVVDASRRIRPGERCSLADFILSIRVPLRLNSPTGGDRYQPVVERYHDRTYFRNGNDGIVYMQNYRDDGIRYDHDYFHDDYLRQYGRTYLDDFPHIAATGTVRIGAILNVMGARRKSPRLLDIGCAYGPFLFAAHQAGCRVQGLEINTGAVHYVRETLGFSAIQGDLADMDLSSLNAPYDIITLWYVIEHVPDLDRLLDTIGALLSPGGILAFSTPHGRGVSARRRYRQFLDNSPTDHYTVWDIPSARAVLEPRGFRIRRIRVTGHHPERYFSEPVQGILRWALPALAVWSRIARRGDTFEVYAEKRK